MPESVLVHSGEEWCDCKMFVLACLTAMVVVGSVCVCRGVMQQEEQARHPCEALQTNLHLVQSEHMSCYAAEQRVQTYLKIPSPRQIARNENAKEKYKTAGICCHTAARLGSCGVM